MISNFPLVSVVIPCFNAEKYVVKAVQSIIEQSYSNIEIVLIDDASTDKTRAVLDTIHDLRIVRFYFSHNRKKIGAVNEVLPQCKGELITFQDADDWSAAERIELQVNEFLKNRNLGICFTSYQVFDSNLKVLFKPNDVPKSDLDIKDQFLKYGDLSVSNKDYITCATMMVPKTIMDKTGGYNFYFYGKSGEDIFLVYNIVKSFESINIDKPLYNVIRTEGSFTDEQSKGINIKSAYVWKVISKLIAFDQAGINLLQQDNRLLLLEQELKACEEALKDALEQTKLYEYSTSYRLGRIMLKPITFLIRFGKLTKK